MEKIILYGLGSGGKCAFDMLSTDKNIDIVAICDSFSDEKREYMGVPIIPPHELSRYIFSRIVITSIYVTEIMAVLRNEDINEDVITVYQAPKILADYFIFQVEKWLSAHGEHTDLIKQSVHLAQKPPELFPYERWKNIYSYLVANGMFRDCSNSRVKLQKSLLASPVNDRDTYMQQFLCLLDKGDYAAAQRKLDSMRHLFPDKDIDSIYMKSLLQLYIGGSYNRQYIAELLNIKDEQFFELVKGKSIAIVGPCISNEKLGKEIDSHDLVIRMLPSLKDNSDSQEIGSKTNIVYLSAYRLEMMKAEDKELLRLKDIFYVFELQKEESEFESIHNGKSRTMLFEAKMKLFNGFPTFLQRILIDLLTMQAKSVKIFNFDFYTTKAAYKSSYSSFSDSEKLAGIGDNLLLNHAVFHDIASQQVFCKRLLENGLVEADTKTREVLKLGIDEYFDKLHLAFN
ncbi:hypothetical protein PCIT_a1795 [Pseudoalteromonas citrea]|uniref:Uncharacterized protein n=2 Tax=Pseudoalteromonas citrea TaxID=43655 RepID=A0AAD4AMX6_9GAMM|nr:glycosyltransferase family 29 protein [Pseudoalteromonas citrea]KAF7775579.1 hypothetical protein PCIT_a1795 [Pseudoalteromonas citrea]